MTKPSFPPHDLDRIPDPLASELPLPASALATPPRPGRSRRELERARQVALIVAGTWLVAQLAIMGLRPDLAKVPLWYGIACGVLPFVAGVTCLFAAGSSGRLGLGGRVGALALLVVLAPASFAVAGFALSPPYPGAQESTFMHGVSCFNIAMAWTVLPLVAAGIALRGSFVSRAAWRSALVGAGAGLIVAATTLLRCPISGSWHVALSHAGAAIASALLAALVLTRVTRV